MKRGFRGIVTAGVLSVALLAAGPAWGGCGHTAKKGNAAVIQYIEMIPTSCGPRPDSQGGTRLSSSISRRIGHGPGSALLRRVASTGSPRLRLRGEAGLLSASGRNPFGVVVGAGGSNGRLIALIAVMARFAVLALGVVLRRRRMTR